MAYDFGHIIFPSYMKEAQAQHSFHWFVFIVWTYN